MLIIHQEKCLGCGGCVPLCAFEALSLLASGIKLNEQKCTLCLDCVVFCPMRALEPAGV